MQQAAALEKALLRESIPHRPMSSKANAVFRHAQDEDLNVNEFEVDCDWLSDEHGPASSLSEISGSALISKHSNNPRNFSQTETEIECLRMEVSFRGWQMLDDAALEAVLDTINYTERSPSSERRSFAFFVPSVPEVESSWGCRAGLTKQSATQLFESSDIDNSHSANVLGRPDYWAPWLHTRRGPNGEIEGFELSLQHPRWNLQVQGSPLSVWMRHEVALNDTYYIISHKPNDTIINMLRKTVDQALEEIMTSNDTALLVEKPLELHILIATSSFEASKYHMKRFQRFMWAQFNKVDDHFYGSAIKERQSLDLLTKELQIVSYNAASHIANVETATTNATAIKSMHQQIMFHSAAASVSNNPSRLNHITPKQSHSQDVICYVLDSMGKQKMWFEKYKHRKDTTMSSVFNLVTQQDAANNISIAQEMMKDSSSMNAIAALTMFFLPGTFTATVLGAGVFSATQKENLNVHVSEMWWFWLAVTVPLTLGILAAWYVYQRSRGRRFLGQAKRSHPSEMSPNFQNPIRASFRWIAPVTRSSGRMSPEKMA